VLDWTYIPRSLSRYAVCFMHVSDFGCRCVHGLGLTVLLILASVDH
jgi:hypothetical protein